MANQYDLQDTVEGSVEGPVEASDDGLTVAVAAQVLVTSKEAIRQRIRRGPLRATKADGEWRISLDHESTPTPLPPRPHGTSAPPHTTPYMTDHPTSTYTKP